MSEKERTCILCGEKEKMFGYICSTCQDKIQNEAVGKRKEMIEQAKKAMAGRKFGIALKNK